VTFFNKNLSIFYYFYASIYILSFVSLFLTCFKCSSFTLLFLWSLNTFSIFLTLAFHSISRYASVYLCLYIKNVLVAISITCFYWSSLFLFLFFSPFLTLFLQTQSISIFIFNMFWCYLFYLVSIYSLSSCFCFYFPYLLSQSIFLSWLVC